MEGIRERAAQAMSVVALVAIWHFTAQALQTVALPPPMESLRVFWELVIEGDALPALGSTLFRTALGFLLGFGAGFIYGIAVYTYPRIGDVSGGLVNWIMFTPTLIFVFLGLSMMGYDSQLAVVLIVGVVIFPIAGIYMRDALGGLDGDLKSMATSFKAGLRQRVRDIYLPYLIPPMLGGGRVAFAVAWKVTFLCEVFGFPSGLGWQVRTRYTVYDMAGLLAWLGVFIISLLVIEQVTRILERLVVKW